MKVALPSSIPMLATVIGTFGLATLVSFLMTRVAIRPMASLFVHNPVRGHDALVGETCVVRSGTVSEESGQAEVDNGAAGLLLGVRSEGTSPKNGDEAVIISYNKAKDVYLIEPMPV
ncbi:MAG: hypothetical protein GY822_04350 [Deltaproteobacteria bacterium]|nr:hypothetical protein [Deltaproteobacteria bacterium]